VGFEISSPSLARSMRSADNVSRLLEKLFVLPLLEPLLLILLLSSSGIAPKWKFGVCALCVSAASHGKISLDCCLPAGLRTEALTVRGRVKMLSMTEPLKSSARGERQARGPPWTVCGLSRWKSESDSYGVNGEGKVKEVRATALTARSAAAPAPAVASPCGHFREQDELSAAPAAAAAACLQILPGLTRALRLLVGSAGPAVESIHSSSPPCVDRQRSSGNQP